MSKRSIEVSKGEQQKSVVPGMASGGKPPPIGGRRLLSFYDLRARGLRWSRQWLRAQIKAGKFPKPIKIGPATNCWLESDWDSWLATKASERDNADAA